jgi:uncharacterized protein (DUF486 family)
VIGTAAATRKRLFKSLGAAEAAAIFVGLLYVTGYYVNSIFARNYGIPEPTLFRLEYIKIGFVFWLISSGIVLIPFGAFYLTHQVRKSSQLPHFLIGWIGNSSNTVVMLAVPLVLSFFATQFEWHLQLSHEILGFSRLNLAVSWGLAISAFAVICVPVIERQVRKVMAPKSRVWAFRLLIEPVRFGCLLLSIYLIGGSMGQIPWLGVAFGRAGSFVAVSFLFIGGMTAAFYWIRHIERVSGSSVVFVLIAFGICFFYYLSMTTYVYGVYPTIPANRGGRMPVTEAFLETSERASLFQRQRKMQGYAVRGPVYILEQTNDTIYFASEDMDQWFVKFVPVHAVRRDAVPYIRFERIEDGFPRVPRTPRPQ